MSRSPRIQLFLSSNPPTPRAPPHLLSRVILTATIVQKNLLLLSRILLPSGIPPALITLPTETCGINKEIDALWEKASEISTN